MSKNNKIREKSSKKVLNILDNSPQLLEKMLKEYLKSIENFMESNKSFMSSKNKDYDYKITLKNKYKTEKGPNVIVIVIYTEYSNFIEWKKLMKELGKKLDKKEEKIKNNNDKELNNILKYKINHKMFNN